MIPRPNIVEWSHMAPWLTDEQVEQDLLLSRLIVEIANDDYLSDELVFRGGTCLHKLRISPPLRYSEDLDYVRRSEGGIRDLIAALRSIGERLGMKVSYEITKYPKVRFAAPFESGSGIMKVKIEVNTFERSPALPPERVPYTVESSWFTGSAHVQTFAVNELLSTKIRALFQRSKGRDLFDLWLGLTQLRIAPDDLIAAFGPYRPEGITPGLAIENLTAKLAKPEFREDLLRLTSAAPSGYDVDAEHLERLLTGCLVRANPRQPDQIPPTARPPNRRPRRRPSHPRPPPAGVDRGKASAPLTARRVRQRRHRGRFNSTCDTAPGNAWPRRPRQPATRDIDLHAPRLEWGHVCANGRESPGQRCGQHDVCASLRQRVRCPREPSCATVRHAFAFFLVSKVRTPRSCANLRQSVRLKR